MEDTKRAERIVQILVHLQTHPKQSFSVSQLMTSMQYSESERRNIQRDMQSLATIPGKLVISEGSGPHKVYRTGLNILDKLDFPNFEENMLQFVFLKRIENIYPGTASLIDELIDKIFKNLPCSKHDRVREAFSEINSRVLFMGTPPDFDETASDKLNIILQAIRTHREISVQYHPTRGAVSTSNRVPLMIVLFQNEIYLGCVRHSDPNAVYALKVRRMEDVSLTNIPFLENQKSIEALRQKVNDLSLFDGDIGHEKVELTFPAYARQYIEEQPYHRSLRIVEKKGILHVTMQVCVNTQLVQWLLYHTQNEVKVVKPEHLKRRLYEFGQRLTVLYGEEK